MSILKISWLAALATAWSPGASAELLSHHFVQLAAEGPQASAAGLAVLMVPMAPEAPLSSFLAQAAQGLAIATDRPVPDGPPHRSSLPSWALADGPQIDAVGLVDVLHAQDPTPVSIADLVSLDLRTPFSNEQGTDSSTATAPMPTGGRGLAQAVVDSPITAQANRPAPAQGQVDAWGDRWARVLALLDQHWAALASLAGLAGLAAAASAALGRQRGSAHALAKP